MSLLYWIIWIVPSLLWSTLTLRYNLPDVRDRVLQRWRLPPYRTGLLWSNADDDPKDEAWIREMVAIQAAPQFGLLILLYLSHNGLHHNSGFPFWEFFLSTLLVLIPNAALSYPIVQKVRCNFEREMFRVYFAKRE